jgi:hypothetical protein
LAVSAAAAAPVEQARMARGQEVADQHLDGCWVRPQTQMEAAARGEGSLNLGVGKEETHRGGGTVGAGMEDVRCPEGSLGRREASYLGEERNREGEVQEGIPCLGMGRGAGLGNPEEAPRGRKEMAHLEGSSLDSYLEEGAFREWVAHILVERHRTRHPC